MQQNVIYLLLNIIGIILFIKWVINQVKDYRSLEHKLLFFSFQRFKYLIIALIIIATPLLLVNNSSIEEKLHLVVSNTASNTLIYSIILSFLISAVWLKYITKIDVFDKEKKRHILLILVLSIVFTCLSEYPYKFIHFLGFTNSKAPIGSFLYCVFGIGFIEETIKFIPLLLVLKFTKAIDEPYDYLLYASASALGFAFVENAMYLNSYGLDIINARAMYATVAHMTFSSTIAYGLFLIRFKKLKQSSYMIFIGFYFLAILSHGFYDFWLINEAVSDYMGMTTLFFLATVHIWFVMKNNTINASNFFNKNIQLNNDTLKVYLMISLLSIFMISYIYVAVAWNENEANSFFLKSIFAYGYIVFYLIATLSKYNVVQGVLKPIELSIKFLFPKIK